ncbi:uncharacterized protein LOC111391472 [Olea europaea var. sylvestris]|uniref:uncharacterized protein LOC111391472 n=1 Tax=Olea europaea var. sylvestris TaxID=158386 RepID=UPI000C1D5C0B|nr:uncharacterized protein LOC111391472 [Olea europaea var. sylvestris]
MGDAETGRLRLKALLAAVALTGREVNGRIDCLSSNPRLKVSIHNCDTNVREVILKAYVQEEYIRKYIGVSSSAHNQARVIYELFKNQEQRMIFCGHDESENSNNQGNFLKLLHWLCDYNAENKVVALTNAPKNFKLTSPKVQRDIMSAITSECPNVIIKDVCDSFFSILVDESRDISVKEQITITALLKTAIDQLFSIQNLSISNLRGQGYDGVSNMRVVAHKYSKIETFFTIVYKLVNVVVKSAKRSDLIRDNQRLKTLESLSVGEISSERGLNQEITLQHLGDTRWGSHFSCLINLIIMLSTIVNASKMIATDTTIQE